MESYISDIEECIRLLSDDLIGTLANKLEEMRTTIYVDVGFWNSIKQSAQESPWIPPQYYMNDWVSDVCSFLREDNYAESRNS